MCGTHGALQDTLDGCGRSPWKSLGTHHVQSRRNVMIMVITRSKSHASTSGPPAESMPAVDVNREEENHLSSREASDDACNRNPRGRWQTDGSHLKNRGQFLKIGTWNTRTLYQDGKIENLVKEARELNTDILGISETRWTDEGKINQDEYIFIYSGGNEHKHGVGLLIKDNLE